MTEYECHLSRASIANLLALSKKNQSAALQVIDSLGDNPFRVSDYTCRDEKGSAIENILIDGFVVAYRVDHAICEVHITDILKV